MSWLPLYNSWLICFALVGIFYWKLWLVGLVILVVPLLLNYLVVESASWSTHFPLGFWLFIGSEVVIFITLFFLVFHSETGTILPISDTCELPLLGTFLLIGSSITATCWHHGVGLRYNILHLLLTLVLGFSFIALQLFELYDCSCDILMDVFYSSSFCTVGLHFLHVIVGIFLLFLVLFLSSEGLDMFYGDLAVWYWHFVDYIWLLVFFVVYCTSY